MLPALNVHTGQVIGQISERRPCQEMIALLQTQVPAGHVIHRSSTASTSISAPPSTDGSPPTPGRVQVNFLPYHVSWLNQIEIWFSILRRRCLRRGDFPNPDALQRAIRVFIHTYNRLHARPLKWTYTGDPLAA